MNTALEKDHKFRHKLKISRHIVYPLSIHMSSNGTILSSDCLSESGITRVILVTNDVTKPCVSVYGPIQFLILLTKLSFAEVSQIFAIVDD